MARVLLVDDDVAVTRMIQVLLEHAGHDVSTLTDPTLVAPFLTEHRIDAILLDLMMPELTGWDIYNHLRSQPETVELPVLFVSGTTDINQKVRGIRSRYCDFINKPFEPAELVARLEKLVNSTATEGDLHGDLSTFSLEELSQSLQQNKKTGELEIITKRQRGKLQVQNGLLISAHYDGFNDRDAFLTMLEFDHGYFWFRATPPEDGRQGLSIQSLIMEYVYWQDELGRHPFTLLDNLHVQASDQPAMTPDDLPDAARRLYDHLRTRAAVDVMSLLDDRLMPPLELQFALGQLRANALISVESD